VASAFDVHRLVCFAHPISPPAPSALRAPVSNKLIGSPSRARECTLQIATDHFLHGRDRKGGDHRPALSLDFASGLFSGTSADTRKCGGCRLSWFGVHVIRSSSILTPIFGSTLS
jgi:hypothetical protein